MQVLLQQKLSLKNILANHSFFSTSFTGSTKATLSIHSFFRSYFLFCLVISSNSDGILAYPTKIPLGLLFSVFNFLLPFLAISFVHFLFPFRFFGDLSSTFSRVILFFFLDSHSEQCSTTPG